MECYYQNPAAMYSSPVSECPALTPKQGADRDRREQGIEFNNYLETIDIHDAKDEVNIDFDFITLQPTQKHLLQAALDIRGSVDHSTGRLQILQYLVGMGTYLCNSDMVKTQGRELQAYFSADNPPNKLGSTLRTPDQSASLVPVLNFLSLSTFSIATLQAMFEADPNTDISHLWFLVKLVQ
jgi:hypothetical protein